MLDSTNEPTPLPPDMNNSNTHNTIGEEEDGSIPGLGFPYDTDSDDDEEPCMYPIDSDDSNTESTAQGSTLSEPEETISSRDQDRAAISTTPTLINCDTLSAEDGSTHCIIGRCTRSGILLPSQIIHTNTHIL